MHRYRFLDLFVPTVVASCMLFSGAQAFGQDKEAPLSVPAGLSIRQVNNNILHPKTLAAILDGLDWDAQVHGPLLIVSPEDTKATLVPGTVFPKLVPASSSTDSTGKITNAIYRTADAADYFDRKIVPLNTLSVLAPRTMRVLNYEHLPKPDPYAGMTSEAKLHLLSSTFTEGQWRLAASEEGIGLADLDTKQQALFLSQLPEPFQAGRFTAKGQMSFPALNPVTLTPEQRETVRLQFAKTLSWTLCNEKGNGGLDPGPADNPADSSSYYVTSTLFLGKRYGVDLQSNVPNRMKPSQLPADWPALEVSVDLHWAKTVGELVAQIAKQTGTELYCDPRYAGRTLVIRGNSAKAADLLRALAWALTGTWRRLDTAFVLTDDLVGLGVRYAKIDDWLQQNALLARQRNDRVAGILAEKEYRSTGWSPTNPFKPSEALAQKIDAIALAPDSASPKDAFSARHIVPVADLPTAAQDSFKRQLTRVREMASPNSNNPLPEAMRKVYPQPLRTDAVAIDVRLEISYIVPGLGKLRATNSTGTYRDADMLAKPPPAAASVWGSGEVSPVAFVSGPKAHALLIRPKSVEEIDTMAKEAHVRGFDRLWVEITPERIDLLTAAIRSGTAYSLAVHAAISVLRPVSNDSQAALAPNIFGETTTQYLQRRHQEMEALQHARFDKFDKAITSGDLPYSRDVPLSIWGQPERGAPFLSRGDYREITPAERQRIVADVVKITATPGLAGVVLEDTAPPGFEVLTPKQMGDYYQDWSYDPLRQMGYSSALRLACLRQNAFDPIDLTPLPNGDRLVASFGEQPEFLFFSEGLPFFRDYGTNAQTYSYNGHPTDTLGAKDAWRRWCAFRQEQSKALVKDVGTAIAQHTPHLPVLVRRYDDPLLTQGNSYFGWERQALMQPAPGETSAQFTAQKPNSPEEMKSGYLSLTSQTIGISRSGIPTQEEVTRNFPYWLKQSANWGGVVLDLSDSSPTDAMSLLRQFPTTIK